MFSPGLYPKDVWVLMLIHCVVLIFLRACCGDWWSFDRCCPRIVLVTGVANEVTFGGNDGNMPVSFSGSSTSVRLCPTANSACDEKNVFTVDNVLKYLANYTYVHVDEMRADRLHAKKTVLQSFVMWLRRVWVEG